MPKIYDKKCKICNKEYKSKIKQRSYCSEKCKKILFQKRQEKRKQTCLLKYGVDNPSKNKEISNKIKLALNNKTKKEWEIIKLKRKNTCNEKYNTDNPMQDKSIISRMRNTLSKRSSEDIVKINKKREETCLKRYNKKHYNQTKECKEKVKNTYF